MAADEKWYFTKEQLQNTPSRKCGFDADKELSYRQQAANFIQDMGQKLQVSQLCINTAIVYMHRFYMFHSFTHFPWNTIAAASFFLAAKVEEQPRKLEHVIRVANLCLHRDQGATFDAKSEQYAAQSQDLVFNENVLLQTLGFDVAIDHPHTHVVRCCHLVRASKDLAQTSYFMASNSLHLTTMCLQYKPTVVACFCIHLACKWSNWQIPKSNEGKDWFYYVDKSVTSELLEQLTAEFLVIFDKCPSRLKRKILSISTTAQHSGMEQAHPTNTSSPFDTEPRKTHPTDKDAVSFHARMHHEPKQVLPVPEDPHKKVQRPHDPSTSQQRVDYREYKEKKDRERLEREKAQHHIKPGLPPVNKHLQPSAQPTSKPPHGHHRPPIAGDPKLKMHHRPSGSREQLSEGLRDTSTHPNREPLPGQVNREYNREQTNGRDNREGLMLQKDHREVHREVNKEVQKHTVKSDVKVDSELIKVDSVDKQRYESNRPKVMDPKLFNKHDPNRHKYPKRPDSVPNNSNSEVSKKLVSNQSASEIKNSFITKQTNSTSQRHKSPFSDVPKSVPLLQTPVNYSQKTETRNGNHSSALTVPVDKQTWSEATTLDDPGLLSPPPKRAPSLFSPEKTTPPKKTWNTKTPPSAVKKTTDTPQLPSSTVPQALSPFASPPPKITPGTLKRHRTSSSGSEPELRPVVKKLDQISGFENIIRDSKMGIKLPKVPDIIQPICDRTTEMPAEALISKELKPPDIIKPFNMSGSETIPLSQPLVNGIETNPTLISNLLKEVTAAPPLNHLPVIDNVKSPVNFTSQSVIAPIVVPPTTDVLEKHRSEHHHKSEKKKKKEKHKHKDKDKSKDEKKKKHKDKDKEKHKIKSEKVEEGEVPLKITIAMDKIQPPPPPQEPSGLKVKISKDRIENPGSLKIKISKDAIQYNSVTDGSRKRDREKSSPVQGPPTKSIKTTYNCSQDNRQNGRNSYSKVALPGDGDTSQLRLAESKYHSKGASKTS